MTFDTFLRRKEGKQGRRKEGRKAKDGNEGKGEEQGMRWRKERQKNQKSGLESHQDNIGKDFR